LTLAVCLTFFAEHFNWFPDFSPSWYFPVIFIFGKQNCVCLYGLDGTVIDCSPAVRAARVGIPNVYFFKLLDEKRSSDAAIGWGGNGARVNEHEKRLSATPMRVARPKPTSIVFMDPGHCCSWCKSSRLCDHCCGITRPAPSSQSSCFRTASASAILRVSSNQVRGVQRRPLSSYIP
jgi:hypothetical protein